ncbi:unnamed protein product [Didymodactylos carnosus]|uniref:Uncharacterized protein n=1 Tax=Didymodactylos carnosus TaxID=1234261 RepID=A0A815P7Q8_9BILA|nr:unnamed protein product [Didymodactylos carnosus]CAF4320225.1 unnamed protein product [Didymodactylos carnosus]
MNNVCLYCDALKWTGEAPDMCCSSEIKEILESVLINMINDNDEESVEEMDNENCQTIRNIIKFDIFQSIFSLIKRNDHNYLQINGVYITLSNIKFELEK